MKLSFPGRAPSVDEAAERAAEAESEYRRQQATIAPPGMVYDTPAQRESRTAQLKELEQARRDRDAAASLARQVDAEGREARWAKWHTSSDYRAALEAGVLEWARSLEGVAALHVLHESARVDGVGVPATRAMPRALREQLFGFKHYVSMLGDDFDHSKLSPAMRAVVAGSVYVP